jgi:hypothetical protein
MICERLEGAVMLEGRLQLTWKSRKVDEVVEVGRKQGTVYISIGAVRKCEVGQKQSHQRDSR